MVLGCRQPRTLNTFLFTIPFLDVVAIRWHPLKPLDMRCRVPHQHLDIFQVLIGLIVRNFILVPRWFVLSSTTSLDSLHANTNLVMYVLICLPLGRYTLILVYHQLFPSICLFNLSRGIIIWAAMIPCLCKHFGVLLIRTTCCYCW